MSDRMSVTVDRDKKAVRIAVGNKLGVHRQIEIDLTDAESIVSGILEAANAGDQMVQAQLGQLAQRVEALEKFQLAQLAQRVADLEKLIKGDKAAGATS